MADEAKKEEPGKNTPSVPTKPQENQPVTPPNAAAVEAVRADAPGKNVTQEEQTAGKFGTNPQEHEPEGTQEYTLKEGMEHRAIVEGSRKTFVGGEKVSLTPTQYASFKDKFEPVASKADSDEGSDKK